MITAEFDDGAVVHHQRDAHQVIGRHAVFQAVSAAGIHGDVARDGASELARRIGGVEEALMRDRAGDGEVGDAALHPRHAIRVIDVEDLRHLGGAEDDRVPLCDGPTRERGARPARHDPHAVGVAIGHHLRDLLGGGRQHDSERHLAIGGEPVRLEGAALILGGDQRLGGDEGGEAGDDLVAAGQDGLIGLGKADGHVGPSFMRGGLASIRHHAPAPGGSATR